MSDKRVYFLRPVGQLGPIKIGCSKMPELRLDVMTIWSPVRLEFICSVPGTFKDERTLHSMFAKHRVHGEWFGASKELLALIDHCQATGALPALPEVVAFPSVRHVGHRGRAAGKREPGTLSPKKMELARQLRGQIESGLTAKAVAEGAGISYHTVCRYIRAAGGTLTRGTPRLEARVRDKGRAEEFKRRYLAGETLQQIAVDYGLTRERVRQVLRKTGVESLGLRPEHQPVAHELTDSEIAAAKAYDADTPPREVCAQYGLTYSQLLTAVRRLGLRVRPKGHWLLRRDDADITRRTAELYQSGLSAPEIVKRVPQLRHPETVYRYLRKAGVQPRNPSMGNFRRSGAA